MTFRVLLWNVLNIVLVISAVRSWHCWDCWSDWETWSNCTVSCGGYGTRTQQRQRRLPCPAFSAIDTYWSYWCGGYNRSESCGGTCSNSGKLKPTGSGCDCLDRSFGHCCEQLLPGCTPFPTDVIFVLDSSASQTEKQFQAQLDFVIKFVEHVNISAEEFQIAVVTFSTEAKVEIDFNQTASVDTLRQLIRNITFRSGVTFTNKGLSAALDVARKSERRKGMVTLTYTFVLTDGMSNKRADTRLAAESLKKAGVHVMAIGIGNEVSHKELKDIASRDSFSSPYVFSVGDFNALDTLLKQLVKATCNDCSAVSHLSDIVFLLDETNQMSDEEFQLSIDVMTSIVQSTDRIGEPDGPRFGLVQVSSKLQTVIQFSNGQMRNQLQIKLQTLQRSQNGACEKDELCSQVNITTAASSIVENFFQQGGRGNSRRFIVVLSNGRFQNSTAVETEMAENHKSSDVKLFVIGPGLDINMYGLLSLVKEANHVYVTLDKDDMSKLDILTSEFSYNVCIKT